MLLSTKLPETSSHTLLLKLYGKILRCLFGNILTCYQQHLLLFWRQLKDFLSKGVTYIIMYIKLPVIRSENKILWSFFFQLSATSTCISHYIYMQACSGLIFLHEERFGVHIKITPMWGGFTLIWCYLMRFACVGHITSTFVQLYWRKGYSFGCSEVLLFVATLW